MGNNTIPVLSYQCKARNDLEFGGMKFRGPSARGRATRDGIRAPGPPSRNHSISFKKSAGNRDGLTDVLFDQWGPRFG